MQREIIMSKQNRLRFTTDDDLCLLREVLCHNPFANNDNWAIVHTNTVMFSSKEFSRRTIKEHVDYLMKAWGKEDRSNLKKSGTEEQYDEKCQLLQDITDLCRDFKKPIKNTKKIDKEKGLTARSNATKGMLTNKSAQDLNEYNFIYEADIDVNENLLSEFNENSVTTQDMQEVTEQTMDLPENNNEIRLSPRTVMPQKETDIEIPPFVSQKRKKTGEHLRQSTINYLEEKHFREQATLNKQLIIEEHKLELERKRLKLDTEKFEFEKKEKLEIMELDIIERKERLRLEIREREERLNYENKEKEEKLKLRVEKFKIASQQQTLLQLMMEQIIKKT